MVMVSRCYKNAVEIDFFTLNINWLNLCYVNIQTEKIKINIRVNSICTKHKQISDYNGLIKLPQWTQHSNFHRLLSVTDKHIHIPKVFFITDKHIHIPKVFFQTDTHCTVTLLLLLLLIQVKTNFLSIPTDHSCVITSCNILITYFLMTTY